MFRFEWGVEDRFGLLVGNGGGALNIRIFEVVHKLSILFFTPFFTVAIIVEQLNSFLWRKMSPNCLEPRLGHCFGLNGASKIGLVCWWAMAAVQSVSESLKLFTNF